MNVAVLGASKKPDRYSYKAVKMLQEKGHVPFPVHPGIDDIEGTPVFKSLSDITEPVDTITVYLSAPRSDKIAEDIERLRRTAHHLQSGRRESGPCRSA